MSRSVHLATETTVRISAGDVDIEGNLTIPAEAHGIVVFAHGSGSSRFSPRNRSVAVQLNDAGYGTLLLDLLTPNEEEEDMFTSHLRFDIKLLSERVISAVDWITHGSQTRVLSVGLFGASTGAAAAIMAAAKRSDAIRAIVSRGGRPDLANKILPNVTCPVLLIVGGEDYPVIEMNQETLNQLEVEKRLEIIPGASHLFEEPGALEQVSALAISWFDQFLPRPNRSA